jgi:hypothetical protein
MLLLQQAREFIHEGTGAYESALGQQATNAKSGRAVMALQNQHWLGPVISSTTLRKSA